VRSVTKLDPLCGGAPQSLEASPGDLSLGVLDLVDAMDDHTRWLLSRKPRVRRGWLVPRGLLLADLVGLCSAYLLATLLWGQNGALGSSRELLLFAATLPCWAFAAKLHGMYGRDQERADHTTTDDVVGVFHLVTVGIWLFVVVSRVSGSTSPSIYALITLWASSVCLVPIARTLAREACRRTGAYEQNTVIVGAGDVGQLIGRKLVRHPEYGINVVGFVDRDPRARRADLPEHLRILGGPERLPEIIERLEVERVVVAFSSEPLPEVLGLVRRLRTLGVQVDLVPRLFDLVGPRTAVHSVEGIPLIGLPPVHDSMISRTIKRAIDIVGAVVGLILLAPLLAYIAVRIRLGSKGPILFRQTRLGAGMKEFTVLKFRTMKVDTDQAEHRAHIRRSMTPAAAAGANGLYKLDRIDAVTRFGRWLRRTSLDELPQLINILRGEMSLVGPRPCIPYETEHFEPHHFERFVVPQGLTGLWQVTARANASYGEALEMDTAYARGWSLGLDLRLLLRTPLQVIKQRARTA
jgi:exopolysaccharide biosynthesis polyprenyl glycosylphosphotransferase